MASCKQIFHCGDELCRKLVEVFWIESTDPLAIAKIKIASLGGPSGVNTRHVAVWWIQSNGLLATMLFRIR